MAPTKQSTKQQLPTADDFLFLLSIVSNPNRFIAEHRQPHLDAEPRGRKSSASSDVGKGKPAIITSASWQQTLTSMPIQRRQIVLALQHLANALQKWNDLTSSTNANAQENKTPNNEYYDIEDALLNSNNAQVVHALQEVEDSASTIRIQTMEYMDSIPRYITSSQQYWHNTPRNNKDTSSSSSSSSSSDLAKVGCILTSQLIHQLQWDATLTTSILAFLNEQLYNNNNNNNNDHQSSRSSSNNNESMIQKLRVWADAISKMIHINTSFWNFCEREVYDETLRMEALDDDDDDENNNNDEMMIMHEYYLNGESSTRFIIPIDDNPSVLDVLEEGGGRSNECTLKNKNDVLFENGDSLHEHIISSTSIEEAVDAFINSNNNIICREESSLLLGQRRHEKCMTSILLVGEEGCGKTHLLDSIQQQQQQQHAVVLPGAKMSSVKVLRPKYPVDLVGNSIGSSEDRLIALFSYASHIASTVANNEGGGSSGGKCLILLDDIDRMFSLSNNDGSSSEGGSDAAVFGSSSSTQYYIGRRCKAIFLTILDALHEHIMSSVGDGHLMLLCTSRSNCSEVIDRFDTSFRIGQPDETQRHTLISSCLSNDFGNRETGNRDDTNSILSPVVHHSAGRSAFELAQCCRDAILRCAKSSSPDKEGDSIILLFKRRLQYLDKMLQTKSPQSLRGGSLDGIVDMRVYTPDELQSKLTTDANGEVKLPLLGAEAKRAHEALMNVVITPLCRSDEIRELLYGGSGNNAHGNIEAKPIRVGALLSGAPGVGKTSLAYHCASLAAKISRVSLLDVSCTSLIHKEIGGSERAVQRLFAAVRAAAPCILLLDGIECVAPKRGNDTTSEGTMDRVLSTFLTEMDGIETGGNGSSGNVAVIGVTNNPDLIDPSLLRPGRLEKTINLGAPDFEARMEIISRQIKDIDFDFASAGYFDPKNKDDVSRFIATEAAGMSAVEVIAICREASMECLRELNFEAAERPMMKYEHFKSAARVIKGNKGNQQRSSH